MKNREKGEQRLHIIREIQTTIYRMGGTTLSKENRRIIETIAPPYPDPIQPSIKWQEYIESISKNRKITEYAHHLDGFVNSQPFKQLQNIKPGFEDSDYDPSQPDLDYKHLADYAGFLFICLFNKWHEPAQSTIDDQERIKQAFAAYYQIQEIKNQISGNPFIKIDSNLELKPVPFFAFMTECTLELAAPSLPIEMLVVKKYSEKQQVSFEHEGTQGYIYTVSNEYIKHAQDALQKILKKQLQPHIEIYQSPFTECSFVRWRKPRIPLNVEYFMGGLYAYAVQYCTVLQDKWLPSIIAITEDFCTMNDCNIKKSDIENQFDRFAHQRKTPDRKEYKNIFLQVVHHNTINKYYVMFYNAFRDWKLDLLYRQGTIKTEYYFNILSREEFLKQMDLIKPFEHR